MSVLRTHAAFSPLARTSRITTAYSIEGGTVQSNDSIVLKEVGGPFGIVAGSYHTRAGKQGFYLGYSPPGLHSAFGIGFDLGSVKMLLGPPCLRRVIHSLIPTPGAAGRPTPVAMNTVNGRSAKLAALLDQQVSHFFSFPARLAAWVGQSLSALMADSVAMSFLLIFRRCPQ